MHNHEKIKQDYERDGFVVVPQIISPDLLTELRIMLDKVLDKKITPNKPVLLGDDPDVFLCQIEPGVRDNPDVLHRDKVRVLFHLCHTHSWFWNMAVNKAILDVAQTLLGDSLRFYTDQTFLKPAHHGSEVPWHQDAAYWPAVEPCMLSCWLALDDVTVDNGCMRFIPGSHKNVRPHDSDKSNLIAHMTEQDLKNEVPITMKAGSASFHHSLALHRSLPNTTDGPRRGMIMIYMPANLKFHSEWNFPYGFPTVRQGIEQHATT